MTTTHEATDARIWSAPAPVPGYADAHRPALEERVAELHAAGESRGAAVRTLRVSFPITLTEAKSIVLAHPGYRVTRSVPSAPSS